MCIYSSVGDMCVDMIRSYFWKSTSLMAIVGIATGSPYVEDTGNGINDLTLPSPPSQQEMYEAAEDMWARVQALNTLAPEFQGQNNTEVVAQVGGEVTFSCYTYHLSDEMVTWLKRDDDSLITVGQQVYATENRFSVVHSDHSEAWKLWIKDVQTSDTGQYECQLTTYPPVSFFFNLQVTQAEANIRGPSEVHIEEGSLLSIECYVLKAPVPPLYIFWYHNSSMVNYGRQNALGVQHTNYSSTLTLLRVRATDAGTYTCEPYLAIPANITVHVVSGKQPAAMQHGRNKGEGEKKVESTSSSSSPSSSCTHGMDQSCRLLLVVLSLGYGGHLLLLLRGLASRNWIRLPQIPGVLRVNS